MPLLLINAHRMQPAIAPVGLDYLAAALQDADRQMNLLDLCWEAEPLAAVKRHGGVRNKGWPAWSICCWVGLARRQPQGVGRWTRWARQRRSLSRRATG
jgi:hypothetical protein